MNRVLWKVRLGEGETYQGTYAQPSEVRAVPVVGDTIRILHGLEGDVRTRTFVLATGVWVLGVDTHMYVTDPSTLRHLAEDLRNHNWRVEV